MMDYAARPLSMPNDDTEAEAHRISETLYLRHARRIYNLALRFATDAQEAEDLTQEVFVRVLTKAHTLEPGRDPAPWVTRVAVSVFLNRRRKRPSPARFESEPVARVAGPGPEALEDARSLLSRLPPRQRLLFLLVHYESHTASEAAALTGLKLATVKSHLKRARRALAAMLDGRSPHELP